MTDAILVSGATGNVDLELLKQLGDNGVGRLVQQPTASRADRRHETPRVSRRPFLKYWSWRRSPNHGKTFEMCWSCPVVVDASI